MTGVREAYLAGAAVVVQAVGSPEVAAAWDERSVLEGQTIGMLAGHVARGGVWVVGEYLPEPPGEGPIAYETAADYYGRMVVHMGEDAHVMVRRRSAEAAARGHAALVATLEERLREITVLLDTTPDDRVVKVIDGNNMRLLAWLGTRVIEQTVHLDDLARSLGVEPWPMPAACEEIALDAAVRIGAMRHGAAAMVRTLYRAEPPLALPVL